MEQRRCADPGRLAEGRLIVRAPATAAIVTVGTELVRGMSVDTNTSEIGRALTGAGVDVLEAVSVADDEAVLTAHLGRCVAAYDLVVVTGGLGPTHDDVTRQAAAAALGLTMVRDAAIARGLDAAAGRHSDPRAAEQIYRQADVLEGATVLPAVHGTAPGQIVPTGRGSLVLLPGPPREMRPLLGQVAAGFDTSAAAPAVLRCAGISESDLQVAAQDVLGSRTDVELTVLAKPGDVRVVLFDRGAGADELAGLSDAIADRIGEACYSRDGSSLAEVILARARRAGWTIATAESCTGGLLGGAITEVPGSSESYAGGAIVYSNELKATLLGVDPSLIEALGAVSDAVARAMASGARDVAGADLAVSVTGVAGPGGGTEAKPVGTVWFGIAGPDGVRAEMRRFSGDRFAVRERAVTTALDLLRRALPPSS
jgi:nicotinamide-nucleotide amidase